MTEARTRALSAFEREYGKQPTHLAWGPGRVNLIGEHTDYNDGFVMPMALERRAMVALTPRTDGRVRILADDLGESGELDLGDLGPGVTARGASGTAQRVGWLDYPKGMAWSLLQAGEKAPPLTGFDGVLASDVPRGAGLSSSAAVELAVAAALLLPGPDGAGWDRKAVARAARRAENEWVGVASGIMDQLIGTVATKGSAVLIDCRDLSLENVSVPESVRVVVLDTGTRRGLAGSAYNDRRAACERVSAALGVVALRDVVSEDLPGLEGRLDAVDLRRARHVVEENARTVEGASALQSGDVEGFGLLMAQSHASLRDLYQVSSPALDTMVEAAEAAPGCLGARMTGAGFGGCAVALVRTASVPEFIAATTDRYERETGTPAEAYVSAAGPGAGSAAL